MSNKRRKSTNADKRAANAAKQLKLQQEKPRTGALSGDELDQLETLLQSLPLSDAAEENALSALSIKAIDGLFAALALHPQMIMPSEWMEYLLGDSVFTSQAQAEQVMGLLMRHYNHVVSNIRKNIRMGEYNPLLTLENDLDDTHQWCRGFILGSQLGEDDEAFMMQLPEESDAFASFSFILAMQSWDVSTNDFFPSDRDALDAENMKGFINGFKQITVERFQSSELMGKSKIDISSNFFATYMALLHIRAELDASIAHKPLSAQRSRILH